MQNAQLLLIAERSILDVITFRNVVQPKKGNWVFDKPIHFIKKTAKGEGSFRKIMASSRPPIMIFFIIMPSSVTQMILAKFMGGPIKSFLA